MVQPVGSFLWLVFKTPNCSWGSTEGNPWQRGNVYSGSLQCPQTPRISLHNILPLATAIIGYTKALEEGCWKARLQMSTVNTRMINYIINKMGQWCLIRLWKTVTRQQYYLNNSCGRPPGTLWTAVLCFIIVAIVIHSAEAVLFFPVV